MRPGTGGRAGGETGSGGRVGGAAGEIGSPTGGAGGGGLQRPGGGGGPGGRGGPTPAALSLKGSPIFTRVQRLTNQQWARAVADVLRLDAATDLGQGLQAPAAGLGGFSNDEKLLFVDGPAERALEVATEDAAARATGTAEALTRLYGGTDAAGLVREVGRRAFRRPLSSDEEARYQRVFAVGEQLYGSGFGNGAALVVRALLQSPHFLYRSELGTAGAPLDGYEAAAKLSFWLLGTTPSDELLDAAGAGGLDSADGLERAALVMLARPDVVETLRDFHRQLYRVNTLEGLAASRAPPALRDELVASSARFFDTIFTKGEGLRAILTSPRYFLGPELAPAYGVVPAPAALEERMLDGTRIGYFMQVPFLLTQGLDDGQPDTIGRGWSLNRDVLCVAVDGHAGAPLPLQPLGAGQTNRARVEQTTAACTGCHAESIDPLGLAFEGFDGQGRARATDNGTPVNTSGSYPFATGTLSFADARALMRILADEPQAHACYAGKLASYALQRELIESDRPAVTDLGTVSRDSSLKELVVALVRHPTFRLRAEAKP